MVVIEPGKVIQHSLKVSQLMNPTAETEITVIVDVAHTMEHSRAPRLACERLNAGRSLFVNLINSVMEKSTVDQMIVEVR